MSSFSFSIPQPQPFRFGSLPVARTVVVCTRCQVPRPTNIWNRCVQCDGTMETRWQCGCAEPILHLMSQTGCMRCGCIAPTTSTELATTTSAPAAPTAAVPRFTFGTTLWSPSQQQQQPPPRLQLARPPTFHDSGEEKRPAASSFTDTLRIPARGASQWLECVDATPLVFASGPDETCTVCMARVHSGGDGIITPCGHIFHGSCMSRWLARYRRCPVCNAPLDARVQLTYILRAADPRDSSNDAVPSQRIPFHAPPGQAPRQVHIHTDNIHIHHTTSRSAAGGSSSDEEEDEVLLTSSSTA